MLEALEIPNFSIVTVTLNSAKTIKHTVNSVGNQVGATVEHILKDGKSSDNTVDIAIRSNPNLRIIIRSDIGVYDAMNQGFAECRGDYVAFLNSDDTYIDQFVLRDVAQKFESFCCDFVYGDILMLDQSQSVVRNWHVGYIQNGDLFQQQLPHPALFIRRSRLKDIDGPFDKSYKISADLKQQLILINVLHAKGEYIERQLVRMALGGKSTSSLNSYLQGWAESYRAWVEVHGPGALKFVFIKVVDKLRGLRKVI